MKFFKNMNRKSAGFTLVELVVVIAVLGMITSVALPLLTSASGVFKSEYNQSEDRLDVQLVKTYLTNDIHSASKINQSGSTALSLSLTDGTYVEYSVSVEDGKRLLSRTSDGDTTVFGEIDDVDFTVTNGSTLDTTLTVGGDKTDSYEFSLSKWSYKRTMLDFLIDDDVFLYCSSFTFGGDNIKAADGACYINGDLINKKLNGGSSGGIGTLYVKGKVELTSGGITVGNTDGSSNIYINGDLKMGGGNNIYGTIYVLGNCDVTDGSPRINNSGSTNITAIAGNMDIGWSTNLNGSIYYGGTLTRPQWRNPDSNINYAAGMEFSAFPGYEMLQLKGADWFAENGYTSTSTNVVSNTKIYSDASSTTVSFKQWGDVSDLIIVATGDVTISCKGGCNYSGLIFAPNGSVTFSGGSFDTFTGIIICKDGANMPQGGVDFIGKSLTEVITDASMYPFVD